VPHMVVLAGPNGAGKSTTAPLLLRDTLSIGTFVNADDIARGLAGFAPQTAAITAGRIMLGRLAELAEARESFAFETTLAGRGIRRLINSAITTGYEVHLFFLWLPSADLAAARVRRRVEQGGHDVPIQDIRRRFARGLLNFFDGYQELVTGWRLYDSSLPGRHALVAYGADARPPIVLEPDTWAIIQLQVNRLRREGALVDDED
jgi:predicted ABC-type ATPase